MRYIIFSDIHSNLESLNAFKEVVREIDHDKKVCLGDIVGYGADPNPVVEWVAENVDIVLAGNHDYAVLGKTDLTYFNPYALNACLWTRNELTDQNRAFLESLPNSKKEGGIFWVHSSPFEPDEWHYVISARDGRENFASFQEQLCFLGHSHQPVILVQQPDGTVEDFVAPIWDIEPDCRYIINVGSLGQPRDGNPDPAFVIFDSDSNVVEFRRFSYDIENSSQKILDHGLPYYLAERLFQGV